MTTHTLSPALQMVQDFRDMTTGDGTYANVAAIAASVNADPATVGVLACVSTHRETPAILAPNQAIALEWLAAADPDGTAHTVHRFTHWAIGWIDYVIVNTQRAAVVDVCADIMHRLDAYPLLDEERCYAHEWEANHPADGECYADDDCPCRDVAPAQPRDSVADVLTRHGVKHYHTPTGLRVDNGAA
jgi:hypothetical protein